MAESPCAVLVGSAVPALRELLTDVLLGLNVRLVDRTTEAEAAVVLAIVGRGTVGSALIAARSAGGAAPIVAILPFDDEEIAGRALACGARACYALPDPLDRLREIIRKLLPAGD